MTTKEKLIIAVAIVAGIALLAIDGITGQTDCESSRYDQTTGQCLEER